MSKRMRSAPAHFSAYASDESSDDAAREQASARSRVPAAARAAAPVSSSRQRPAKKAKVRRDGDEGETAYRFQGGATLANSVAANRSRRQTVMSAAGAAAAAERIAAEEIAAPLQAPTFRSARLQQTKRKSYKEMDAGESEESEESDDMETEGKRPAIRSNAAGTLAACDGELTSLPSVLLSCSYSPCRSTSDQQSEQQQQEAAQASVQLSRLERLFGPLVD